MPSVPLLSTFFDFRVNSASKLKQIRERVAKAVDAGKAKPKTKPRPKPKTRRPARKKPPAEAAE